MMSLRMAAPKFSARDLLTLFHKINALTPLDIAGVIWSKLTLADIRCIELAVRCKEMSGVTFDMDELCDCASRGHLELIKRFHGGKWVEEIYHTALKYGQLAVITWCQDQNSRFTWNTYAMEKLALHGHTEAVIYGWNHGGKLTEHLMYYAAKGGHAELLQRLHSCGCEMDIPQCVKVAAFMGHRDVIIWFRQFKPTQSSAYHGAIGGLRWDLFKWLYAEGVPLDAYVADALAASGHLEMLKWAFARGCENDSDVFASAVAYKRIHVLEYLHEIRAPFHNPCLIAARMGHLEVLQWLRSHDYDWNIQECWDEVKDYHLGGVRDWIEAQM